MLGDAEKKIPGIREIAERSEAIAVASDTVAKRADESVTRLSANLQEQSASIQALREEIAISGSDRDEMHNTVRAQSEQLDYIKKELTHNGGSSVKDMVKGAMQTAQMLMGLFRSQADMNENTAFFSADTEGRIVWVSKSYQLWTMSAHDQLFGNGWINNVHPDERDNVRDEWQAAIKDSRDFYMEYRMIDSDRDSFWVRSQTRKLAGPKDSILGWYGQVQRLTDEEVVKILSPSRK